MVKFDIRDSRVGQITDSGANILLSNSNAPLNEARRNVPTVLIVCASPLDQDRLRLGAEEKEIRSALQRSKNREHWRIETNQAATVDDLRRALLDHDPTVVHFAGHGGKDGLCFEDDDGSSQSADARPLAKLFHLFRKNLKCVVLNACCSQPQAELIREEIDYVIGMGKSIDDDSARKFAVSFYDAVLRGRISGWRLT
jgi:hypothetical protein